MCATKKVNDYFRSFKIGIGSLRDVLLQLISRLRFNSVFRFLEVVLGMPIHFISNIKCVVNVILTTLTVPSARTENRAPHVSMKL